MKNNIRFLILPVLCLGILLSLTGCRKEEKLPEIYVSSVNDADVFIDLPALRQYGYHTCGTTCVQMIMNWVKPYEYDINLIDLEEELGTTEENGTSADQMEMFFKENDITVERKEEMTISELAGCLDSGYPVMVAIQAWADEYNLTDPADESTYLVEGHWVICVGYEKNDEGYRFYFNDPANVGYCVMDEDDFDNRWIDMDGDRKVYRHFGLVIKEASDYNNKGTFYLQ